MIPNYCSRYLGINILQSEKSVMRNPLFIHIGQTHVSSSEKSKSYTSLEDEHHVTLPQPQMCLICPKFQHHEILNLSVITYPCSIQSEAYLGLFETWY